MLEMSSYIGTSLNGSEVKSKGKNPIEFLQNIYITKGDRTSHWVVHSYLKELYINDLFERKQMIEYIKDELTEAPKTLHVFLAH